VSELTHDVISTGFSQCIMQLYCQQRSQEAELHSEIGHITCCVCIVCVQQMRRSGNDEDNKRIIMDLDVVIKSHSCPYIIQCIGTFIFTVETSCSLLVM